MPRYLSPKGMYSLEVISKFKPISIAAKKWTKASVIFFHGSGKYLIYPIIYIESFSYILSILTQNLFYVPLSLPSVKIKAVVD